MRSTKYAIGAVVASAAIVQAITTLTLGDICTTTYVKAALPADNYFPGISVDLTSVTASVVTNASTSGQNMFPDTGSFDFCNVTFAYSHTGRNDRFQVNYWLPAPGKFQNRYLTTGVGGLAINSGTTTSGSLPGGLLYGAVAGLTDGGFGSFKTQVDAVYLDAPGVLNYDALFAFGYKALHELTIIGKQFTKEIFKMGDKKLYAYYQACSEGGREGWSQIQRYAEFDGAITGAPAFRYSFQQVQHLFSNVVEKTVGYYPSPCEFMTIVNATIAACDPLDGKTDGVVSRTDLCKLHFNIKSVIGKAYDCPATAASGGGGGPTKRQFGGSPATPAQVGKVTAKGVEVAQTILDGLKDSSGKQVYLSYQPAATFADAGTAYNSTTKTWGLSVSGLGAEWVTRFLELRNTSTFDDNAGEFTNVTYDTLKGWMIQGLNMYSDVLQTIWPDLTPYHRNGGKVLHFHGESDNSIPTASSVRYWESVRSVMYPGVSYNASAAALNKWYRLYLVPGAAHCAPNPYQPNGPFPQTNLAVMIDWVEKGAEPVTLNATVLAGSYKGTKEQICAWPLRPLWKSGKMECLYDQKSIDTWHYKFDGVPVVVY